MCAGTLHTGVSTSWPSLPGWSQWEPRQTFCEQIWTGVWREYTRSLQSVCVQLGERVIREHNNISYFLLSTYCVPGPVLDTLTQRRHLTLTTKPPRQAMMLLAHGEQMGKLRLKEVPVTC